MVCVPIFERCGWKEYSSPRRRPYTGSAAHICSSPKWSRSARRAVCPEPCVSSGDWRLRAQVSRPSIYYPQVLNSAHPAYKTRCMSLRWSITPTIRSASVGSVTGTPSQLRIQYLTPPWRALESHAHCGRKDGRFGTNTRWRVLRSSEGKIRWRSSMFALMHGCRHGVHSSWRRHYQDAYSTLLLMFGSTAILPPRTKRWAEAKVLADCINVKVRRRSRRLALVASCMRHRSSSYICTTTSTPSRSLTTIAT